MNWRFIRLPLLYMMMVMSMTKQNITYKEWANIPAMRHSKTMLSDIMEENLKLKQTMKDVAELLSEEVDLFSDKATEHDINAYIELKELDNKDAYDMAVSIKKAIKMLKGDIDD